MPVTAETYQRVALEDPEGQWELHRGRLREKPAMTFPHNDLLSELSYQLRHQIDPKQFRVRPNTGRVSRTDETYYIPDVFVIPISLTLPLRGPGYALEVYTDPLPFIAEVWLPSTDGYDVDAKLPQYLERGDIEIWRLHPYERTLTIWRRLSDGSYSMEVVTNGIVRLTAFPDVTIDLDALWAFTFD